MLFDLSSPRRKTAVRIVFGGLAALFAIGFVGFGIGSDGGAGGFADIFTGGSDEDSAADALEQQIEEAEEEVDADPEDQDALVDLIGLRVQSGDIQLQKDEAGFPTGLSEGSRNEYEEAISLWEEYLGLGPNKVDETTASRVVLAYRYLGDVDGAVSAQEELVNAEPKSFNYAALAELYYYAEELDKGDKALDDALAADKSGDLKALEKRLAEIRKAVVKAQKQEKKAPDSATGDSPALSDPFGTLNPDAAGGTTITP